MAGSADADAIVGLFIMPREFVPTTADEFAHGCQPKRMRVMRKGTIDTYTPRNNKLFCYPYNELYVTNNNGNTAEYKVENFLDPYAQEYDVFSIWGNCSMQPGMYCAPVNYNGVIDRPNFDDEITVTGFPMCSYTIDSFKAWLAQNAGMIMATASDIASDWVSVGVNAGLTAAGVVNPFGNTAQNAMSVMNQVNSVIDKTSYALGALYDHKRRPPQVHGNSNGNLTYQAGQMTFCWYHKQIKTEYAAIIDKFFDMYGYKTNRVGTPNLTARPRYSYVKTIGCSIDGMIPGDMKAAIEGIFDKGIRFWMPYASFGNYDPEVNDNRAPTGGD